MTKEEIAKIRTALAGADDPTIREIIREAESFLSAQLQAGLASDLRAMTMAVILAAVLSFLVGGTASLLAAKIELGWHLLTVADLVVGLGASMLFAIYAAKPTGFDYAGSNPRFWVSDIDAGHALTRSLAGQAAQYAAGIAENIKVLDRSHRLLHRCLLSTGYAIAGALVIEFVLALTQFAKTGSFLPT
jgi:hypothetical protein